MDGIVNPKVTDYIQKLGGFPELQAMEDYARANYIPIVLKDAARLLAFQVAQTKPERILELGTAIGYSAILMALYSEAGIVTIEREEDMKTQAEENIRFYHLEKRIKVVLSDCVAYLKNTEESFDFIFMDAGKSHYREYFDLSLPILRKGGMILCDNVLYKGLVVNETAERKHGTNVVKLQEFLAYIHSRDDLMVSLLSVGDGMLLIRRKDTNE